MGNGGNGVMVIGHAKKLDFLFEIAVGPRLIGPTGTEDFSPLSQDNLKREVISH